MAFDLLLKNISNHVHLTSEETSFFLSLLQPKKLKKKQFLLQEGEINSSQAFVLNGCLRSYSIDKNGFEHIQQFAPADWWIGDMYSFIKQKPATLYIDAIFDSEIALLSKADLENLYERVPKFERYFRILLQNSLITYQHRLMDNLGLSAKERYDSFCRSYPSLIETLPQKQVAAYIGVTPEFLSKMLNASNLKK